jgi:hypothetical protein
MKNFFFHSLTLVMLSFFALSCGEAPSNILSGVKVETRTEESDVWLSFAADLNLGAMSFASVSVPVLHPRGQTPIGQLELGSALGGVNQIKISINVSELSDIQTSTATLPNGNMIPLLGNNEVIAVEVGKGAKIYLVLSEGVTALGVAVPIGAFDNIGRTLPGLNLFPIVRTGNIIGTAGIFTGATSGQNGIAVVADLSQVVNFGKPLPEAFALMALDAKSSPEFIQLDYQSHTVSQNQKKLMDQMIGQLNLKRTILRMKE